MKNGAKLLVVAILVVVAALACSLGQPGGGAETQPSAAGGETVTQEPAGGGGGAVTQEPAGGGGAPTEEGSSAGVPPAKINTADMEGLDSYRARFVFRWTPTGGAEEEMMEMEQEVTNNPSASRVTITYQGESMEWGQIGDMAWTCSAGQCVQFSGSETDMEDAMTPLNPDEFAEMADEADMVYQGQETVNGILADHYTFPFTAEAMTAMANENITTAEAEVWVAAEPSLPQFMVRFQMSWEGEMDGQTGSGEYSYEVYDVNVPLTIEPPEGLTAQPEDLPQYPNATGTGMVGDITTFSTSDDAATVADYYRNQLPALGWSNESDTEFGGVVMQVWHKEGRTASIAISPQDGGSGVVITVEGP